MKRSTMNIVVGGAALALAHRSDAAQGEVWERKEKPQSAEGKDECLAKAKAKREARRAKRLAIMKKKDRYNENN